MGMSEGGGKMDRIQERRVVEQGVIYRDKQGLAAWAQVLIVSERIAPWSWLVSLLSAGTMGFYIASPILRNDYVGRQDIQITQYDSMADLMKDVSNDLWDGGLCLIQGFYKFVVDVTTHLVTESSEIYILGVASGRHSKGLKMLCNYPLMRKISVLYFRHCHIGGVTKCACVLIHNIPLSVSVQEELNGKVRPKLESIIKVNDRCLEVCAPPGQGAAGVCGVREIAV